MNNTKRLVCLLAALLPSICVAEQGDWVFRLRATDISPSESSKLGQQTDKVYGTGSAATVYGSSTANLKVDDNVIPEFDISYYVTKNIALELILALGSKHDVKVSGSGGVLNRRDLGEIDVLPPTLTAQWHFNPDETFDPYVGAGVSYVYMLDKKLKARTSLGDFPIRVDRDSWGPALQAGLDVNLKDGWLINFDVKKIWFDTDVKINAPVLAAGYRKIDSLDVDPLVVSVGIGKKF